MRRAIVLIVLSLCGPLLHAQQDVAIAKQGFATLLGVGARANAMGGAFIAIADDPTAASWNPAGLAHISRPGAAAVWDEFRGEQTTGFRFVTAVDDPARSTVYTLESLTPERAETRIAGPNFISIVQPIDLRWHFVAQASYRGIGRFPSSKTENDVLLTQNIDGRITEERAHDLTDITSTGGIDAYTLSLAVEPAGRKFRAGLSLNLVDGSATTRFYTAQTSTTTSSWDASTFDYTFRMVTVDAGVQYDVDELVTIGAVYHGGGAARADITNERQIAFASPTLQRTITSPLARATASTKLHWPHAFGFGVAYRVPGLPLVVSGDYSLTSWSGASVDAVPRVDFALSPDGTRYVPTISTARDAGYPYFTAPYGTQHDAASIRAGAEYILRAGERSTVPLRAGYFVEDQILNSWAGAGAPKYRGITCGVGLTLGNHVQFDLAGVFTSGKEQYSPPPFLRSAETFGRVDVSTRRIILSTIIQLGQRH
ncbi:MAG: long-chain fatty acid transport protein [Acidobacteriota bacterium]|jgi:hypothetical protein|nr:long-chain fatty acid transport protein [Acidobacteriota bacterium]